MEAMMKRFLKQSIKPKDELETGLKAIGYDLERAFATAADVLDPDDPTMVRKGMPLTQRQYMICAVLGVRSRRGEPIGGGGLIQPTQDPLSTKALREQAPEELIKGCADAQQRHQQAQELSTQAFGKWRDAMNERRKFARATEGATLSDTGLKQQKELDVAIDAAMKAFKEAEDVETQARVEVAKAEVALQRWVYAERERRQEEEKQAKARAEKKPEVLSISERLTQLRGKFAG